MPLGHVPELLTKAVQDSSVAGWSDEQLQDVRSNLDKLEQLASEQGYWKGPKGYTVDMQNPSLMPTLPPGKEAFPPKKRPQPEGDTWRQEFEFNFLQSPPPDNDGWRPGLAQSLLHFLTNVPMPKIQFFGSGWFKNLQPATAAAAATDPGFYWKNQAQEQSQAVAEGEKRAAEDTEGKAWAWEEGGWKWKEKQKPPDSQDEDDQHSEVRSREAAVESAAIRAVANVASTAGRIAERLRLAEATAEVMADPTTPPAGISGWSTPVIDNPPGALKPLVSLGMQDKGSLMAAWHAAQAVQDAASDHLLGGDLRLSMTTKLPLGAVQPLAPGMLGRQGRYVTIDPDVLKTGQASFASSPLLVFLPVHHSYPQLQTHRSIRVRGQRHLTHRTSSPDRSSRADTGKFL
eukprot:TRINITY_DN8586_c0_g1_i3.p1 TRINITY_DN8586_c0_g1~~TRINITY_DN8586_c0_g1_i3.p1  ORF type:complete len:437 (-),score=48.07 TRINITY_DN8586_c0_g1_i3:129-1334(-)